MGAFRFLHRWTALVQPDDELADAVPLLEDRDRELEDYLNDERLSAVSLLDYTNTLDGGSPTIATTKFSLQAGTNVNTPPTTYVSFDTPFPNGLVSVVACFGDSPGVSDFYVHTASRSGFNFASGAVVGHRIDWIAIGW